MATAALTLLEYAAGQSFGLDEALIRGAAPIPTTALPGRMGINTAVCFILSGASLALLRHEARSLRLLSQGLAVAAATIAATAVVGYGYSVHSLSGLGSYTQMALHTAAMFVALGVGIISGHDAEGIGRVLSHPGPGAMLARWLLPVVLIAPFLLGCARLEGERAGWYGTEIGVAMLVIATSLSLAGTVLAFASRVDRIDEARRRAEREVRTADERMRFALDATGTAVWEVNTSTDRVAWSGTMASLFGVSEEDAPRSQSAMLSRVHSDDRAAVQEFLRRALGGEGRPVVEFRTAWPDGTTHWIHTRAQAVDPGAGQHGTLLGVSLDVTDRRSLEEQLCHSQKLEAIGHLAGGVAHDLNNVLTAILGFSDIILSQPGLDAEMRSEVEEISKAGDRASRIIRQLLAFGRRQVLRPTVLDMNALVGDLQRMLKPLVREDVRLELRLHENIGRVKADPIQIEQIIVNLVVNARDAMSEGGTLTIETANATLDESYQQRHAPVVPGEYVMLSVTDTGAGMDAQTRQRIFEPFFTTKAVGKGTGLGLATVFGIVKQSGGYIWVYSEPGCGATFKVYLRRVHETVAPMSAPSEISSSVRVTETILVVEDDPVVRALARRLLEQRGYKVLEAGEPAAALSVARSFAGRIHLLLSDVIMPGHVGGSLFEQLARDRPGLRVLYMSGYADETIVRQGLLIEGTPFMEKPFTAAALADRVRGILDRPAA
jgi:PAS domain S-box-containing protein